MPNPNEEPEIEILSSQSEAYDDAGNASSLPTEKPIPAEALEELEEWKKKHDDVKEQLVWMAADFDNYKKRALKEKDEFLKFSQAGLLKEMLVVVDNLERALAALPADDQDKGLLTLKQGVDLTLKQFRSILEKHGVTKIKALGEKFDPKCHEVMFQQETDQYPDDTVMEELQSGYFLHERVLRPALVKVAKNHKAVGG
ncbi:MAG TPA: nucleotide exchange factor GrpE [bacterium]|nr:nucleotide exchange factor GrpE [bacterium]